MVNSSAPGRGTALGPPLTFIVGKVTGPSVLPVHA